MLFNPDAAVVVEDMVMVMLGRGIAEADHFLSGESQLVR
jgi:hypothetical protein